MELTIRASTHTYQVHIEENMRYQIEAFLPKQYTSALIITDSEVEPLYLNDVKENIHSMDVHVAVIPSGEASKSFAMYEKLQTIALEKGLDRKSLIIALGGGVVGDLSGFVAATYMRGIDYVQIPTTILAHDSSVGGKVAINHPLGKNMIGSFHAPVAVLYDVNMLETLPAHEIRSGYAELVKEAFIASDTFLADLFATDLEQLDRDTLKEHLYEGIKIKAAIVEEDEQESGVRKYLNFGHTLGHAIEAQLGYGKMTHGEAIAIGMLFAIQLSEQLYDVTLPYDALYNWLQKNNYPLTVHIDLDKTLYYMKLDKKSEKQIVQMVLLKDVAQLVIENIEDERLLHYLEQFSKEVCKK